MNPHILFTQAGRWLMGPEQVEGLERRIADLGGLDALIREGPRALAANGVQRDKNSGLRMRGDIAIIPIKGVIMPERNCASIWSGWTTCEGLVSDLQVAISEPSVREIVFDVDSPGGNAIGVQEAAEFIASCRGKKRMTAHVGGMCASAAYWLASAADEIVTGATGESGSIGVVTSYTKAKDDTKTIVSTQSPMKRPDFESEEGAAAVQETIDQLAAIFVSDVARNRSVSEEKVLADFGRGWIKVGQAAVEAGLADRVASFETLMSELENRQTGGNMMEQTSAQALSAETVRLEYPAVYGEITAAAAAAERERILTIQSMAFAGMEDFCAALIAEGATTGEAAVRINAEEKRRRATAFAEYEADAKEANQVMATITPDSAGEKEAALDAEAKELARKSAQAAGVAKEA